MAAARGLGALVMPVRQEEWFRVMDSNLLSINVYVYPEEIVPMSEKVMKWMSGKEVYDMDPDGDFVLVKYQDFREMLIDLGFGMI